MQLRPKHLAKLPLGAHAAPPRGLTQQEWPLTLLTRLRCAGNLLLCLKREQALHRVDLGLGVAPSGEHQWGVVNGEVNRTEHQVILSGQGDLLTPKQTMQLPSQAPLHPGSDVARRRDPLRREIARSNRCRFTCCRSSPTDQLKRSN